MTLLLPDLSEFQPDADLAGIKGMNGGAVILRACYGTSHPDAAFARHRAAAASLGYQFTGLYQYLVAGQDAVEQAREFIRLAGRLAPHEVAILDLEEGDGDQAPRAAQWAALVDGTLGGTSWLYSGLSFAQDHGLGPVFAGPRHTWVAAYGDTEPDLGHTLWQSTDGTNGSHITAWPGAGRCDTNVYRGTLAQLAALTRGGTPAVPAKPATPAPRTWTAEGQLALHDLAAAHLFSDSATVLALTARNSPGAVYAPDLARYIDTVFAADCARCPAGITWHYPGKSGQATPWLTRGQDSLATLAAQLGTAPSAILQVTADIAAGGKLQPLAAGYINQVFAGSALRVPAGTVLYYGPQG